MSQPSSPSLRRVLCGLAPLAAAGSLASVAAGGSTEVFTIMQSTGVGDNAFIEGLEFDRFDRPTKSPTGSRWVALVRNTGPTSGDAMIVVGEGTTITLAALEGASEPEPGRFFSTSDRSVDINEAGQWVAIGNLVGGGSDDDEVIYLGDADGSMVTLPFREGQDIPPGTVLGSNNYGPSIQADGGTSFGWSTSVAATINYYTADASEILLQFGDVLPGQRGGTDFFLETPFSGRNAFQVSDDGGHWFARGELSNGDAVAIVDGAIVLQVGDDIDGELLDQFPGEQNILESTGDWYVRAATDAGTGLAIVSDVVVAREGDLVGGTVDGERWDGGPWASSSDTTFFLVAGNVHGDVILGGFTDNADESANCVWMLNGSTEVLREGRQLDIDNDGTLDDAFVSMRGDTASPEGLGGFLTDAGELYTNVQLVDGTGTEIGQAFLRLTMAADCPGDLDGSGDVGTTDLLQLLAAWGPCDDCDEDLDGSGEVGTTDLLELLAAWGPC